MKAYKELFLSGRLIANDSTAPLLYVNHAGTAGTARPTGATSVAWFGTVTPSNMTSADLYVNTSTFDISTSTGTNSATGGAGGSTSFFAMAKWGTD